VAAGGVVFLLFFLSMTAPGLVVLALVGFFVAVVLALLFGVRSGVFHYSWLVAVVWIFLWNLVGGVFPRGWSSGQARCGSGGNSPPHIQHTPWRWEPPEPHPRQYSANQKHWSNVCAEPPRHATSRGTGAGRRRQDPAEVAADRVAGVYAVVADACAVGFSPPYKTTWREAAWRPPAERG